jgi:hypothetical protein
VAVNGATAADPNAGADMNHGSGAGAMNGAASAGSKAGVDRGGGGVLLAGGPGGGHQRVVAAVNFGSKGDANSRGGSAVSSNRGAVDGEGGSAADVREEGMEDSTPKRVGPGGGISALGTESTPRGGSESGENEKVEAVPNRGGDGVQGVAAEGSQAETTQLKMALEESQKEVWRWPLARPQFRALV